MNELDLQNRVTRLEERLKHVQELVATMRGEMTRSHETINDRVTKATADIRATMVTKDSVATTKLIASSLFIGALMFGLSRILEGSIQ